jgi:Outer membrane lipoprotein-sorting protein
MRLSSAPLAATLLVATVVHGLDMQKTGVQAVLARPQQRLQSADYQASGHLVRVDAAGARTSYAITVKAHWFPGVLRVLFEIASPADARAHILLEMRPNGHGDHDAIQIAHPGDPTPEPLPFNKWSDWPLGAAFSYEDLFEAQYFWPNQVLLPETKYGARDCDLLKSTPGPSDPTHYAMVQSWLDHSIGYPVYAEKTLKGTGIVKEFTYFGLRQTGGIWSASQVEVKVRGKAGSTLLIIDRGNPKANLNLKVFSPEQLTHF